MVLTSCNDEVTPKPKGYLDLNYPVSGYQTVLSTCPYIININKIARIELPKIKGECAVNVSYPALKGKIYLSYFPVKDNLYLLLKDAQSFTQNHTQRADGIKPSVYENSEQNAYGMVYEVEGNAASPVQFYITDKTNHFLRGSVYFYAKPNYDSIFPSANYLKKDVKVLMETLKWN